MGFTSEAFPKIAHHGPKGANRAWEVWDEPPPVLPDGIVVAFKLVFPTAELAVRPEQRAKKVWKDVTYIEAGPPGQMTVLTLFISPGTPTLDGNMGRSFMVASFGLPDGRFAQLIAHSEPEGDFPNLVERTVAQALVQARLKSVDLSTEAYGYFLGRSPDGFRYLFGARVANRAQALSIHISSATD